MLDCWSTGRSVDPPGAWFIAKFIFSPGCPQPSVAIPCRIIAWITNHFISTVGTISPPKCFNKSALWMTWHTLCRTKILRLFLWKWSCSERNVTVKICDNTPGWQDKEELFKSLNVLTKHSQYTFIATQLLGLEKSINLSKLLIHIQYKFWKWDFHIGWNIEVVS